MNNNRGEDSRNHTFLNIITVIENPRNNKFLNISYMEETLNKTHIIQVKVILSTISIFDFCH